MKTLLLTFTLLCFSLSVAAQTSTGQAKGSSQQDSIQGCLTGSDGDFTLTDSTGIKYKLTGSTSQLNSNLDHQVEVKGKVANANAETTNSPMSTDTSTGTQGTGSATKQGVVQTFHVHKVTKIADACSKAK